MIRYFMVWMSAGVMIPVALCAQDTAHSRQWRAENGLHPGAFITNSQTAPSYTLEDRMRQHKVNGASIAVIDEGRIVWAKGYGVADAGLPGQRVDTMTLFQCASIGKVITSLAVLHLVREGKIGLDEPVNDKLTSWKIPENDKTAIKKVTLRTLLSHTAGLGDEYGFEGYAPHAVLPGLQQMLNSEPPANTTQRLVIKTIPGTVEKYSGGGFLIIQQLVEDISGASFSSFADSVIFQPLSMRRTTYAYYPDEMGSPVARGHDEKGKTDKKRKYHVYPEMAAAGPWTTAADLARLVLAMQREYQGLSRVVADSALMREMFTPQINTTGLGIHLKGSAGVAAFWHSGNNAGYTGLLFGLLSGKGAVVLTNSDDGASFAMEGIRSIADAYDWPVMQTRYIKETTDKLYEAFTGRYAKGSTQAAIGKNSAGLFLNPGSDKEFTLYQEQDGSFLIKEKPDHLRMVFDQTGDGETLLHVFQDCGRVMVTLSKIKQ
ncbi:MAG: serine hydrolase domain-containing protein [Chitinophagaceae bacterium]